MTSKKTLEAVRCSPKNVRFADLCKLCVEHFGTPRQSGTSHAVFKTSWLGDPRVNTYEDKGKAKAYQVRQVLLAIDRLDGIGIEKHKESENEDRPLHLASHLVVRRQGARWPLRRVPVPFLARRHSRISAGWNSPNGPGCASRHECRGEVIPTPSPKSTIAAHFVFAYRPRYIGRWLCKLPSKVSASTGWQAQSCPRRRRANYTIPYGSSLWRASG